ncbi:MAG: hypothetical protein ACD_7C00468G0006 [uncultured bacterium]|nr:MAG: hypothetical protein ACD_7C00468G0006 [uncultured bacterium]KKP67281.1 MAG: hypothetical protein UR66_C0018G0021 [Candidatus Moranbacteria bacterium GW2011_GWE1_35_17]KKP83314.1 MAG: hypothetical protein UR82_C0022G0007 [Candidatus Moranbacteria bacterium GW2011_GWF1_35_5]KKP84706.1 MAG: hypothetical protein UR83_C0014G0009 [Candidatus Moranbacteria bacterium GW2011_GWF2_35_54]HBR79317.1 hypothetical protein [Candidatus Moranbacteria bacterium]
MKNKSIITIISAILFIIIAGGGFWIVTNKEKGNNEVLQEEITVQDDTDQSKRESKIDTSNWKIYQNEDYGFEVKYPGEWEISLVENGHMKVRNTISECALIPEGCSIIVLYDKDNHFNSDYVSVHIDKDSSRDVDKIVNQKRQWWSEGELYGCNISANKILNGNNFSFRSFYAATDSEDKQMKVDKITCENSDLNPFFNEIVKNFTATN